MHTPALLQVLRGVMFNKDVVVPQPLFPIFPPVAQIVCYDIVICVHSPCRCCAGSCSTRTWWCQRCCVLRHASHGFWTPGVSSKLFCCADVPLQVLCRVMFNKDVVVPEPLVPAFPVLSSFRVVTVLFVLVYLAGSAWRDVQQGRGGAWPHAAHLSCISNTQI
jgi:hypothetical protein